MTTDRIIYQSESLFTSKIANTGSGSTADIAPTDIKEINRVQDMSYNLEVSRTDINEFGQLAALSREVTEAPTVGLDFSYYVTTGEQDNRLGLTVNQNSEFPITNAEPLTAELLTGDDGKDELNYYIVTAPEGNDVHTGDICDGNHGVIAIGNGFITSYSISGAVGELATASVSVEGSNISFKGALPALTSSSADGDVSEINNPSIDIASTTGDTLSNKIKFGSKSGATITKVESSKGTIVDSGSSEVFAIRPGDISIDFDAKGFFEASPTASGDLNTGGARLPGAGAALGSGNTSIHIQSFTLDVPVSRTGLNRLGNHFAFARKIDFPVNMSLTVSALATDITDGSLDDLICSAEQKRDIAIKMKTRCGDETAITYVMRNAILDTQSFSASIGDNKTVDLTFSAQVGGANDTANGIFAFGESQSTVSDYGNTITDKGAPDSGSAGS